MPVFFAIVLSALFPLSIESAGTPVVARQVLVSIPGSVLDAETRTFMQRHCPGGVVLFRRNIRSETQLRKLIGELQDISRGCSGRDMLIALDAEGGGVRRFRPGRPFSDFPAAALVAATGRVEDAAWMGRMIAQELSAVGVNMNLAPVADLELDWRNGLIRGRSFGSDPEQVAPRVEAFVHASQAAGVLCASKHFPGHGAAQGDSHRKLARLDVKPGTWHLRERLPFDAAVRAGTAAIMLGHVWAPALDPEERPASQSPAMVRLLRDDLGYQGLLMADALAMGGASKKGELGQAACRSLAAGVDLLILGVGLSLEAQEAVFAKLETCVRDGGLTHSRLSQARHRLDQALSAIIPSTSHELSPLRERHREQLQQLSRRGITLVRDREALLPLDPGEPGIILVPKRFEDRAAPLIQRLAAWRSLVFDADRGLDPSFEEPLRSANRILVLSYQAVDRPGLTKLLRTLDLNKTLVVALSSPHDIRRIPRVSTYIALYHPHAGAWTALVDILLGARQARGRLPVPLGPDLPVGHRFTPARTRAGSK